MSEEMFNKLLAKLETVGGRGWELLVEAEFYNGVYTLVMFCVMVTLFILYGSISWKMFLSKAEPSDREVVIGIGCGIVCVFFGIVAIAHLEGLTSLIAHEAMALRGLIR